MQIDHLCDVRGCCNPAHLEAVTPRVNVRRSQSPAAANATKTHCPLGHAYAGSNIRIGSKKERVCRDCANRRQREYLVRKRAERPD